MRNRWDRWRRTAAVFALALSYWRDARRIARLRQGFRGRGLAPGEGAVYAEGGRRFRLEAVRLGGLLIKVGQFLSARADVLPVEFTRELAALQDEVPAAPFDRVRDTIERAYDAPIDRIFAEFDEIPLAAASLGQVHRAVLRAEGRAVAVKVARPGIRALAATDLAALRTIMRALGRFTRVGRRIDAVALYREFESLVAEELDYLHEQDNLIAFGRAFAGQPGVKVPAAFPEWTRRSVLVMELVCGAKLTDGDRLRAWGLDPRALAERLVDVYLQQIVVDGRVQIDPHAGNFFADRAGRLVLLDFGMCAEIPRRELPFAAQLVEGILRQEARPVAEALRGLGFLRPDADLTLLVRSLDVLLRQIGGTRLTPGPELDQAVRDFQDFLYQEPLRFPAKYLFLGRAIGMLFGLVAQLAPDLDWVDLLKSRALPLIDQVLRAETGWQRMVGEWAAGLFGPAAGVAVSRMAREAAEAWARQRRVPQTLDRVLMALEGGEVTVRPEMNPMLRRIDRLSAEVTRLVVTVGLGVVLVLWGFHRFGGVGRTVLPVLAVIGAAWWVWASVQVRRARHRLEPGPVDGRTGRDREG